jgi:hypothetical protein
MGAFARGQVITLPFPYSDLSAWFLNTLSIKLFKQLWTYCKKELWDEC